ncbi:ribosomal RNA processing protein 36 homolog [Branchiostoma lanceolatum]|uniref:rRNA biogenesis protein RRP36 n=1 Tax=Branchiostoma lanceolatum TaxID=7740 RepID=A0A8J9ZR49_BRALA|nr:RRP36 [Branchiostoma lanceolatum]
MASSQHIADEADDVSSSEEMESDSDSDEEVGEGSKVLKAGGDARSGATTSPTTTANANTMKKELSTMSFEDIQKLRDKIGTKTYNQALNGSSSRRDQSKVFKRANKNRPVEMSSKMRPPRIRQVAPVKKKIHRDPRFDDLSGEYDEKIFEKSYSFLDPMKAREKKYLEKQLQKERDEGRKGKIQKLIRRMEQQERSKRQEDMKEKALQEWKAKEKELVRQGKKPYFLKKSEEKKLVLAQKFKELKKSGKVEKFLQKKRKKNAARDRKHLPTDS